MSNPTVDPSFPLSPEETFEEAVEKIRVLFTELRAVYNCGVGYDYAVIAQMVDVPEDYVRTHAEKLAKRLRLEVEEGDGGLSIPDKSLTSLENRLFEAAWHGSVDGEAFDGDCADIW